MKNNTSILFSLLMTLALSTHVNGSADSDYDSDYELIKFTTEDQKIINSKLIEAAQELNLPKLEQALREGANPNYQDDDGNSACHHVEINDPTCFGNTELKRTLHKHGASTDITNKEGLSAKDLLTKKLKPHAEAFAENAHAFLFRPKPLFDDVYAATAQIVDAHDDTIIQATAELILDDNNDEI